MKTESKFKITYNRDVGKLFDFLIAIENGFNNNKLPNPKYISKHDLIADPYIEELFNEIWEVANVDTLGLALFFTRRGDDYCYCFVTYISKVYEIGDIKSFIKETSYFL